MQQTEIAIQALSKVLEAVAADLTSVDGQLSEAKKERRQFVQAEVERLIPNLSERTLTNLVREHPSFVDEVVRTMFKQNGKLFGLFALPGYDLAMATLKTRLAKHYDEARVPALSLLNATISRLTQERAVLDARHHEAVEIVGLLQATVQRGAALPRALQENIEGIAKKAKKAESPNNRSFNVSSYSQRNIQTSTPSINASSSDATDLWLYFLADVPTSFRTLLLSELSSHNNQVPHDTSSKFTESASAPEVFSPPTSFATDLRQIDEVAGAYAPLAEIATDDSLGAFS